MDHSSIQKYTWISYKSMWDPYLRLNVLSPAFLYRRYSDKFFKVSVIGMKDCLTLPSLGRKLTMSLGQG